LLAVGVSDPLTAPLRDIIARHDLSARKALGQHFLLDLNLTARIAALAAPLAGVNVIEVGPGPGGLTRALLASPAASVTAVEIDRRAIAALEEMRGAVGPRLRVVAADAIGLDYRALVPAPRVVVANLPYNIATPLLLGWLREAAAFERLVLMFQREVADRLCAAPGSPAYGRLAVLTQFLCRVERALVLPPEAFTPPPKVFSAVVVLEPHAEQPAPALRAALERLTGAAFGQRRKMLRGALRDLGGEMLLRDAEIAGTRRAESLEIAEFVHLAGRLAAREAAGITKF